MKLLIQNWSLYPESFYKAWFKYQWPGWNSREHLYKCAFVHYICVMVKETRALLLNIYQRLKALDIIIYQAMVLYQNLAFTDLYIYMYIHIYDWLFYWRVTCSYYAPMPMTNRMKDPINPFVYPVTPPPTSHSKLWPVSLGCDHGLLFMLMMKQWRLIKYGILIRCGL